MQYVAKIFELIVYLGGTKHCGFSAVGDCVFEYCSPSGVIIRAHSVSNHPKYFGEKLTEMGQVKKLNAEADLKLFILLLCYTQGSSFLFS